MGGRWMAKCYYLPTSMVGACGAFWKLAGWLGTRWTTVAPIMDDCLVVRRCAVAGDDYLALYAL